MLEYDPCKTCEYYNQPYWSVVSPCRHCPRLNGADIYVTTTTTNINIDMNDNVNNLPTAKEYEEAASKFVQFSGKWSEPKYQCPKCGGGMCRNEMIVLPSYPAQYQYKCDKCGYIDYQYM